MTYTVTFQPSGRRVTAFKGKTLLEIARGAGEALESICGGSQTCGKPGAMERVIIHPGILDVDYRVIGAGDYCSREGNRKAQGLCGSGLVDAIAQMLKAGVILPSGRFNQACSSPRLRESPEGGREFILAWAEEANSSKDIVITQKDIRAVQLAKAALSAGIQVLMRKYGLSEPDVIILAGAFGTFIDPLAAMDIGMIPRLPLRKVTAVGNAAGNGAKLALFDLDKRREAADISNYKLEDFTWLGRMQNDVYVTAVPAKSTYKSLGDLKKAGKVNLGVAGLSSSSGLTLMLVGAGTKIDMNIISFDAQSKTTLAALRGDVAGVHFPYSSLRSLIKDGTLRPLVVYSKDRLPEEPNTPTIGEEGYPELAEVVQSHMMVAGPPNMDPEVARILRSALAKAMADPEVKEWSEKAKRPLSPLDGEKAGPFIKETISTYSKYKDIFSQYVK